VPKYFDGQCKPVRVGFDDILALKKLSALQIEKLKTTLNKFNLNWMSTGELLQMLTCFELSVSAKLQQKLDTSLAAPLEVNQDIWYQLLAIYLEHQQSKNSSQDTISDYLPMRPLKQLSLPNISEEKLLQLYNQHQENISHLQLELELQNHLKQFQTTLLRLRGRFESLLKDKSFWQSHALFTNSLAD